MHKGEESIRSVMFYYYLLTLKSMNYFYFISLSCSSISFAHMRLANCLGNVVDLWKN